MLMRKISKSGIVSGIVLVLVVLSFVVWNRSARSNRETSATTSTVPTNPTTTIPQVSFATTVAGGPGEDAGVGVGVTDDGGAIITGRFSDTAKIGSTTLTSNGHWDVLVGKITSSGTWVWAKQIGGSGEDNGADVAVTSDGGGIIIGNFLGSATFGSTTLTSNGDADVFVAKISSTGVWES